MTLQECYTALGGDYEEALSRLYSEALIRKFVAKFLGDKSFGMLSNSLKAGAYEEAFRAAHTLKGVSQNLSFTRLYQSSNEITEALRVKDYALAERLLSEVEEDYTNTAAAIHAYQAAQ